jgi:hypothetical protein
MKKIIVLLLVGVLLTVGLNTGYNINTILGEIWPDIVTVLPIK